MLIKKISFIILLVCCISCGRHPANVEKVLESAGDNRAELEKVIEHYKKQGDEEKLKAAYFLIGNMGEKFAFGGEIVENFDVLFDFLDSLHRNKIQVPVASPILKYHWDSLTELHGRPSYDQAELIFDHKGIKSDYLIKNIDAAFKVRNENSWCKKLSFDQFCEYILPYRVGTERLEDWRNFLYEKYKPFRDTTKAKNSFEYAVTMNGHLKTFMTTNHVLWSYPFDMPISKLEKAKRGACKHIVNYVALSMRANGLPVGVDHLSLWGNSSKGHDWNVLLMENGKFYPFDAARVPFGGLDTYQYKFAKVFRESFSPLRKDLPNSEDIPFDLLSPYQTDVTPEYTKTFDITIPLQYPFDSEKEFAVICSFNNVIWKPQDWGQIENGKARFKNMGSDVAYIVMYYHKNKLFPASNPFILGKDGTIKYLEASEDKKQEMTLLRKYPVFHATNVHLINMLGVRFQGANKPDFSDSVNLFTVTNAPAKFEKVVIDNPTKFRYVRYISRYGDRGNVAELEFYGEETKTKDTIKLQGKIIGHPEVSADYGTYYQNAFDGDLGTYFLGAKDGYGWAGLDLGKPTKITKIRYCPRSDTNFILVGDTYELCYWKVNKWMPLGKQVAKDQFLIYKNVPANGLYLLHNLSRGIEERIFSYENGKQVWW